MPMTIHTAALRIGRQVPETETMLDEALLSVSSLIATLVQARMDTGVPAATGQATLARLAKAQMSLVTVSSNVLRAHRDLVKIAEVHAGMDLHECPKGIMVAEPTVVQATAS
jgi:hypothetical protein